MLPIIQAPSVAESTASRKYAQGRSGASRDRSRARVTRYGIVARQMITTPPVEPVAAPWHARPLADVLTEVRAALPAPASRPLILAIDGRSASGKTTMAARLSLLVPGSTVVHSDDVAWWESFFGWDHLMASGILEPLHRGEAVRYRPPAWEARGREGAIQVAAGLPLVIIEGVGVSRRSLAPLLDAALWVQSDMHEARRRGIERDGATPADIAFWDEWDREELPFMAQDRPWERALAVVCGTPGIAGIELHEDSEVLVGRSLRP